MEEEGLTTRIVHAGRRFGVEHGGIHKPIHTSVQYGHDKVEDLIGVFQGTLKNSFNYARQGTPTTAALEALVTEMEQGRGSICFSTGMAALSAVFLTLLKAGDHLVSSRFVFGNTNSLFGTLGDLGVDGEQGRRRLGRRHRSRAAAEHAHRVCRNDRQPRHTGARPGRHRAAVPAARPAVRGGQHRHLAGAVPPAQRRRGPGDQFTHEDDRRPWRSAGRRRHRHRRIRLARLPQHLRQLSTGRRCRLGFAADSQEGPARHGRFACLPNRRTRSALARRRWRCGWRRAARARWHWPVSCNITPPWPLFTIRCSNRTRNMPLAKQHFGAGSWLLAFELRDASAMLPVLNRLAPARSRQRAWVTRAPW